MAYPRAAATQGLRGQAKRRRLELRSRTSPSNGEAERPRASAGLEPWAHTVFPRPRRHYRLSRPAPVIVRGTATTAKQSHPGRLALPHRAPARSSDLETKPSDKRSRQGTMLPPAQRRNASVRGGDCHRDTRAVHEAVQLSHGSYGPDRRGNEGLFQTGIGMGAGAKSSTSPEQSL